MPLLEGANTIYAAALLAGDPTYDLLQPSFRNVLAQIQHFVLGVHVPSLLTATTLKNSSEYGVSTMLGNFSREAGLHMFRSSRCPPGLWAARDCDFDGSGTHACLANTKIARLKAEIVHSETMRLPAKYHE